MKYILEKEELEEIKTKLLSDVSDFFIDIAKNKREHIGLEPSFRSKTIYIDMEVYNESIEKLRDKLAETINNL